MTSLPRRAEHGNAPPPHTFSTAAAPPLGRVVSPRGTAPGETVAAPGPGPSWPGSRRARAASSVPPASAGAPRHGAPSSSPDRTRSEASASPLRASSEPRRRTVAGPARRWRAASSWLAPSGGSFDMSVTDAVSLPCGRPVRKPAPTFSWREETSRDTPSRDAALFSSARDDLGTTAGPRPARGWIRREPGVVLPRVTQLLLGARGTRPPAQATVRAGRARPRGASSPRDCKLYEDDGDPSIHLRESSREAGRPSTRVIDPRDDGSRGGEFDRRHRRRTLESRSSRGAPSGSPAPGRHPNSDPPRGHRRSPPIRLAWPKSRPDRTCRWRAV